MIELMIALVIVGVLSAIALSSYKQYVLRTNRSTARSFLADIAAKEEVYSIQNHAYTASFINLIGSGVATPVFIDNNGKNSDASSSSSIYQMNLAVSTDGSVATVTATAVNNQAKDSTCATLSLNSQGVKTPTPSTSGGSGDCWSR